MQVPGLSFRRPDNFHFTFGTRHHAVNSPSHMKKQHRGVPRNSRREPSWIYNSSWASKSWVGKLWLSVKCGLSPDFVNTVLLEHCCVHSFIYHLWLLSHYNGSTQYSRQIPCSLQSLKYFLFDPWEESLLTPVPYGCSPSWHHVNRNAQLNQINLQNAE